MPERSALRAEILKRRRTLDLAWRAGAAKAVLDHFKSCPRFSSEGPCTAAAYIAVRGELDPAPTVKFLRSLGCRIALPRVIPQVPGAMDFYAVDSEDLLISGSFGIKEPDPKRCSRLDPSMLDLVLLPLVAFDQKGNRLGMGGGYYDRLLKKLRPDSLRIGLAYDFQRVGMLPAESWDMPLDAVITPSGMTVFNLGKIPQKA